MPDGKTIQYLNLARTISKVLGDDYSIITFLYLSFLSMDIGKVVKEGF